LSGWINRLRDRFQDAEADLENKDNE
jgi:hypothetical protein